MLARLLPALMPSWRFFDAIGPSPRVDYAWVDAGGMPAQWHEFRPRPARVSVTQLIARLLWNPHWNETLYIVRCAERLMEGDVEFTPRELRWRLRLAAQRGELAPATATALCLRVRVISREGGRLVEEVIYVSAPFDPDPAGGR